MSIFAVLLPTPQPALVAEIRRLFPDNHLALNETQYLISTLGTAEELTVRLGMGPAVEGGPPLTGSDVVLAISSYYGRAPTPVWDWMYAKLEAPARGV